MEKIMSKTDTPNDHRPLADNELDAVAGGWSLNGIPGATTPAETTKLNSRKMLVDAPLKAPVW
jgi:hypothetical protein